MAKGTESARSAAWLPRIGAQAWRLSRLALKAGRASLGFLLLALVGLVLPGRILSGVVSLVGLGAGVICWTVMSALTIRAQRALCRYNGLPVASRWSLSPHNRFAIGRHILRDPGRFDAWLAEQTHEPSSR